MMLNQIDDFVLYQAFDQGTLARGRRYWKNGNILKARVHPEERFVSGEISGNYQNSYRSSVKLIHERASEWSIEGSCSCPVGYNCKHSVALLFWANQHGYLNDMVIPSRAQDSAAWAKQVTGILESNQSRDMQRNEQQYYILRPKGAFGVELRVEKGTLGQSQALPKRLSSVDSFDSWCNTTESDAKIRYWIQKTQTNQGAIFYRSPLVNANFPGELFGELIGTERFFCDGVVGEPLVLGETKQASLTWEERGGAFFPQCTEKKPSEIIDILPSNPPWYIDAKNGELGPLELDLDSRSASILLQMKGMPRDSIPATKLALRISEPNFPIDRLPVLVDVSEDAPIPTPVLELKTLQQKIEYGWGRRGDTQLWDVARLKFDYEGQEIAVDEPKQSLALKRNGVFHQVLRNFDVEHERIIELIDAGLICKQYFPQDISKIEGITARDFVLKNPKTGLEIESILSEIIPKLEKLGWTIRYDASFRFETDIAEWSLDIEQAKNSKEDWFDLSASIEGADGKNYEILPVILELIGKHRYWLERNGGQDLPEIFYSKLPNGKLYPIRKERLLKILNILLDLHDATLAKSSNSIRVGKYVAAQVAELRDNFKLDLPDGLKSLSDKIARAKEIGPVTSSADLRATLRNYQASGLGWFEFLHDIEFGGILADDMGLGKTIQVLAHLQILKEGGRLSGSSLIVAPKSLIFNWAQEVEKFTPNLSALCLNGPDREALFDKIPEYDLVITSYPLISRDIDVLQGIRFDYLVLDEAQMIKNPTTKLGKAIRELQGKHRLCLTGTPIENNLLELWSIFDFLIPGFLSNRARFTKFFRTPIEKHGDMARQKALVKRVSPFILRRTKGEVLKELPEKNVIIKNFELSALEKDIYESVRIAMHEKIRDALASTGLAKSQIIVLDALLKLRQICCDARLLKVAKKGVGKRFVSSKLELLLDTLESLLGEGRRVLLFSQFTSMLELIESELEDKNISYVKLTGQTNDRQSVVEQFQSEEVPLFLISLKAGGFGLNLTAADTVIHYDPWWNPAVENQATDRAHRIGQNKNVFVYKFISSGTVEEKIIRLQEKKAQIFNQVLSESDLATKAKLTEEDIDDIFAPIKDHQF